MASSPITSWQIDREIEADFIFLGSKITADGDCSHEIKRCLLLGRKVMINLLQFSAVTQLCPTVCDPMNHSTPGLPVIINCQSLPKPISIESVMPSNHLILYCPFLLLPSIFPASGSFQMSQIFTSGDQSIGVSASTSVLPMNIQD